MNKLHLFLAAFILLGSCNEAKEVKVSKEISDLNDHLEILELNKAKTRNEQPCACFVGNNLPMSIEWVGYD